MQRKKKRIKLEDVVDEALNLLPRGMDIIVFTQWVDEVIEQNKTLPRLRIYKNSCKKLFNPIGNKNDKQKI